MSDCLMSEQTAAFYELAEAFFLLRNRSAVGSGPAPLHLGLGFPESDSPLWCNFTFIPPPAPGTTVYFLSLWICLLGTAC